MDQSLNLLDSLNTALRCDAIQFLLQTLKCKYPDACDQVVRNLFSHITNSNGDGARLGGGMEQQELARTKQLQLLLTAKKEKKEEGEAEIKREKTEDEAGSTDLNQNFEKILCKEEFLCLEEEEEDFLNDVDTQNSSSLQFHTDGNNVDGMSMGPGDPLDLIQTGGSSLLVKRKYTATFEDEEQLGAEEEASNTSSSSIDGKLVKRKRTNNMHLTIASVRRKEERSTLGEGYVFHEDSQYTMHYHHSTGEFSERAFKAQFRALLRLALSQHHKPFLRQFYENFVVTGRLLGTTPSARVLKELREQRLEEWRRQRERRQLISLMKQSELEQQRLEEITLHQQEEQEQQQEEIQRLEQQKQQEDIQQDHQLPAISFGDSELESETESQLSSAAQEIMKFEEFIDEGVGAGRLIDGLEMEPEIDDMLGGAGSALGSVNSASGHSSNSSSSGSGSGNGVGGGVVLENNSHHSNHL